MTPGISLALVIHNHQPVGNFGWVFEDVYQQAYEPMIGALERYPAVHVGLHYSGPLLEWLVANHPEAIERLRTLVERGQVEILGGGLYEPILAALPVRDRFAQLVRMRTEVERLFGVEPSGAWLAERVWEPSVPFDLAEAGYRYTVLDDNHLRAASIRDEDMWGTYTTDDQGRQLTIFGTEKGLRYRIPWRPVKELVDYMREASEAAPPGTRRLGIMGDDGEKFGAWPGTYELCWSREKWVDECFSALVDNSGWLTTVTPSEWLATERPLGRAYIPTASYVEMTEWALPPDDAVAFHALLGETAEAEQGNDETLALAGSDANHSSQFLRGGFWRNFQTRYREVNDLHKKMLRVSAAVEAMPPGPQRDRAVDHLLRGQSNDCYWHGLFGGIYLVHMRLAALAELIAAEDLVAGESAMAGIADYDLDGVDEVMIGTRGQSMLVDVAEGAGIGAWDLRGSRLALASVMRRRPEAYHATLRRLEHPESGEMDASGINPHEQAFAKEADLARALSYDDYERRSGLVRVLDRDGQQVGDFVNGPWEISEVTFAELLVARAADGVTVRKSLAVGGGKSDPRLAIWLELTTDLAFAGTVELEMNLNLAGGGGNPQAYYRWAGHEARFDSAGSVLPGVALSLGNEYEGVDIQVYATPGAEVSWSSVDTVSNSEAGFERVHQGSCLVFRWPVALGAGERREYEVDFAITEARDRSAEEAAAIQAEQAAPASAV